MKNITYNELGTTFNQSNGFTVIIEVEGSHNQVIINDATVRKVVGANKDGYEVQVNGKFLTIRGHLAKGDNKKSFHISSEGNQHIIKKVLGL